MKKHNLKSEFAQSIPHFQAADIKGLVLAGGASKRMGQDKGDLIYYDKPHKYHVAEMLINLGLDTYISIKKEQKTTGAFKYIFDQYENTGPMAGLLSAFQQHKTTWLVMACDYPFITIKHLDHLLLQRDKNKVATVFLDKTSGFLLPTIAIYEPRFLSLMLQNINHKEYSLQKLLKKNAIKIIKTQDPAFKSIDTPAAYKTVKKEIHDSTVRNT